MTGRRLKNIFKIFVEWASPTTRSFGRRTWVGDAHPTPRLSCLYKNQQGVALIGAIFVVVILGMLGIYMVTLSGLGHATASQAVVMSRVYYGAKAGLEWGIHKAIAESSCTSSTPLTAITGLNNITVTVTCVCAYPAACVSAATSVYYLTSMAEYGTYGNNDYAKRQLEATVTGIP